MTNTSSFIDIKSDNELTIQYTNYLNMPENISIKYDLTNRNAKNMIVQYVYGESGMDGIRFLPPVELKVVPIIEAPENKTYNSGSGSLRYLQDGKLTFISQIEEKR
jgi:hypothetical protein